jgi:putative transposase
MDSKGRALDNIFIERLWKSVKYECVYLHVYEDGQQLYRGLKQYFNFYNHRRLHQSLNYQTPASQYLPAISQVA